MAQTTKRALEASLKKLLLRKPLNKITINDITEDCGVNRMTFYYHFKDIYDLVDWILVEDATEALEGHQDFETWSDAFRDMLEKVQANRVLVLNVYRSISREQVEQYLYKMLDPLLRMFIERENIPVQEEDKQFIIDFYKYGFVGMVLEWIRRDMKTEPVLECRLKTGRTHQIRVHMASIQHPVAGDPVYGPHNCITRLHGQCLHAKTLGFIHPITGEHLRFDSELPEYFTHFIASLRRVLIRHCRPL